MINWLIPSLVLPTHTTADSVNIRAPQWIRIMKRNTSQGRINKTWCVSASLKTAHQPKRKTKSYRDANSCLLPFSLASCIPSCLFPRQYDTSCTSSLTSNVTFRRPPNQKNRGFFSRQGHTEFCFLHLFASHFIPANRLHRFGRNSPLILVVWDSTLKNFYHNLHFGYTWLL